MFQALGMWIKIQYRLFCMDQKEQNQLEREFIARKQQLLFFQRQRRKSYRETGEIKQYFR